MTSYLLLVTRHFSDAFNQPIDIFLIIEEVRCDANALGLFSDDYASLSKLSRNFRWFITAH